MFKGMLGRMFGAKWPHEAPRRQPINVKYNWFVFAFLAARLLKGQMNHHIQLPG